MKVTLIVPTMFVSDRGTSMRIQGQVEALVKKGFGVTILTYGVGRTPDNLSSQLFKIKRIPNVFPWLESIPSGFSLYKVVADMALFFKVLVFLLGDSSRTIHAYLYEGVLISWLATNFLFWREYKIIGDFHGSLTSEIKLKSRLGGYLLKKIEYFVHAIPYKVSVSSFELGEYISKDRIDKSVFVFDVPLVENGGRSEPKLSIPDDKTIVTYTGGFGSEKGIDVLCRLMVNLSDLDNLHWIIAGSPIENLKIPKEVDSKKYTIINPLSKEMLFRVLKVSDIGIDPKTKALQGSGKLVNYLSFGLPTVTFSSKTINSYLRELSGELSASSVEDMEDILRSLILNTERRKSISVIALNRVENISIKKLGDIIAALYV